MFSCWSSLVIPSVLLQVVVDHGALELDGVFQLIAEGERLPVDFSKELEVIWPFFI